MAGNDNFCLRLNEFEKNVKIAWQEIQKEDDLCDITLACEDKQIKAHKLIISSCSPVFANILKLNKNPHPLIYLRKVKYKNLQNLLNFIYQGEVNVAEEDLPSFLEFAEDLNIRGLSEKNMVNYDSNEEEYSPFTPSQNGSQSITEKKKLQYLKSDYQPSGDITEYVQADVSFSSNEDIGNSIVASTEIHDNPKQKLNKNIEQNIVSTLTEKQFSCGMCNKQYADQRGLYFHTKSVHEGIQHACDKCDYKATTKSHLNRHVKSVHDGERYPCDECNYKATYKTHLRRHQLKQHK